MPGILNRVRGAVGRAVARVRGRGGAAGAAPARARGGGRGG